MVAAPGVKCNDIALVETREGRLNFELFSRDIIFAKSPVKITLSDNPFSRFGVIEELSNRADDSSLTGPVFADQGVQAVMELDRERLPKEFEALNIQRK
ncbi:Unknown protein sequence [Pseudomonas syringae pv. maculicola]|nr:Unknown protein sequence [Pseudomonas syringae pv. maculicola]